MCGQLYRVASVITIPSRHASVPLHGIFDLLNIDVSVFR